uniref:Acid phosphatase n=1 Tax=Globisporangium ultimum (strain ATCC 200006 / CBS 805.95 / DAOM BR144) TaxID=431595 RepID=K3WPW2_GLOUD
MRTVAAILLSLAALANAVPVVNGADDAELVLLVSLSRHGSRAPNPTVKKLCPNNIPNMNSYQVPPEQLTERGMMQMEATGRHIRDVYVTEKGFLPSSFNGDDHSHFEAYFRADAANRCGQSAVSLGYGLYPDGTGPAGYSKQPIPVYMQLSESEHDFTANGPCWSVMNEHSKHYTATRGKELFTAHGEALDQLAKVCGADFYAARPDGGELVAIKDVADMFLFDRDEGLKPTPGLTPELTDELSQLAFQNLIERLYSTPREITTAIGGFPQLLLRTLINAAAPDWSRKKATKYFSFHGHRELLHGLGFMMGMKFNFEGNPAFNGSTALHPGTTLFFELYRKPSTVSTTSEFFIKFFVWSPMSPRTAVKLDNCALDCPLEQFSSIIMTHIQQTGPWQDICNYHPVNMPQPVPANPHSMASGAVQSAATAAETASMALRRQQDATTQAAVVDAASVATDDDTSDRAISNWALTAGGVAVLGALCVVTLQRMNKRREYMSL